MRLLGTSVTLLLAAASTPAQDYLLHSTDEGSVAVTESVRAHARVLEVLAEIGPEARPAAPAVAATGVEHPELRFVAIRTLDAIGGREAQPFLTGCLRDEAPRVRIAAARILAMIGGHADAVVAAIRPNLDAEVDELTYRALDVAARLGPDATPLLGELEAFLPTDIEVLARTDTCSSAMRALAAIGPRAAGAVQQLEKMSEAGMRRDEADHTLWQIECGLSIPTALRAMLWKRDGELPSFVARARRDANWDSEFRAAFREWAPHATRPLSPDANSLREEIASYVLSRREALLGVPREPSDGAADRPHGTLFADLVRHAPPTLMDPLGYDFGPWHQALADAEAAGTPFARFLVGKLRDGVEIRAARHGLAAIGKDAVSTLIAELPH